MMCGKTKSCMKHSKKTIGNGEDIGNSGLTPTPTPKYRMDYPTAMPDFVIIQKNGQSGLNNGKKKQQPKQPNITTELIKCQALSHSGNQCFRITIPTEAT